MSILLTDEEIRDIYQTGGTEVDYAREFGLVAQRKLFKELLDGNGEFHHVSECSSHGECYCLYPGVIERISQELGLEAP